jgi:probable phosphoglycerate mutase
MIESPVVIILRGPPGVGKTSVALLLRDRLAPAARLSVDLLRYLTYPRTLDDRYVRAAKVAAARLAVEYAKSGISSVIDSVFLDSGTVAECCEILRRGNVAFRVFSLRAPLDEIAYRDRLRSVFDQQGSRIADVYRDFPWDANEVVDTSNRVVEEVAAEIIERVEAGRATPERETASERRLCVFLRHGPATLDPLRYQGPMEPRLMEIGKAVVATTANSLASFRADRIIASPFQRTIESAEIVSRMTGVPFEIDNDLRERHFSSFAGKTYEQLRREGVDIEILTTCSEALEPPAEETISQCLNRARDAMRRIMSGPARRVIVVSHGGLHMLLLHDFLSAPLDRTRSIHLAAGRFSILDYRDDGELAGIRAVNLSTWDETLILR